MFVLVERRPVGVRFVRAFLLLLPTAFLILLSVVSVLPDLLFSRSADYAVQLAVAVVMVVPLVLRRHSPLLAMSAMTLTGLLHLVTIDGPTPGLFAVPLSASLLAWATVLATFTGMLAATAPARRAAALDPVEAIARG